MKNFRLAPIIFATLPMVALLSSSATAMKWPWQIDPPTPPQTVAQEKIERPVQSTGPPPPDDTARFLAGMPLPKNSPLAALTNDPAWQEHSANFEKAFAKLNTKRLAKVRTWEAQYFPESHQKIPVAYYMFSGPDFLYVDQFFPKADVYILCGKESMGPPPDPLHITNLAGALHNLEEAMHSSLRFSFFITKD